MVQHKANYSDQHNVSIIKKKNRIRSTLLLYFPFFSQENLITAMAVYIAQRLIPLCLPLLFIVTSYTIHVSPRCPFETRYPLRSSSQFRLCSSLVHIPWFSKSRTTNIGSNFRFCLSASEHVAFFSSWTVDYIYASSLWTWPFTETCWDS